MGGVFFMFIFWCVLNVLFLNVIFGVIVDTFGLLREQVRPRARVRLAWPDLKWLIWFGSI